MGFCVLEVFVVGRTGPMIIEKETERKSKENNETKTSDNNMGTDFCR